MVISFQYGVGCCRLVAMIDRPDEVLAADPEVTQSMLRGEQQVLQHQFLLSPGVTIRQPASDGTVETDNRGSHDMVAGDINEGHLASPRFD
jgi:hypothetical protein